MNAPRYDENGFLLDTNPCTGTGLGGFPTSAPLGFTTGLSTTGSSTSTTLAWVDTGTDLAQSTTLSFYALSEELIVPEPTTALLLAAGLAGLAVRGRRHSASRPSRYSTGSGRGASSLDGSAPSRV